MNEHKSAIAVDHVTKRYSNFTAVDDLSFEVQRGEIFAMLGPNGAGKTTTIRMILDILKPDHGSITVLGTPINDETKNHIGYLPEERGLYRDVPIIDVLVYLGMLKGMSRAEANKRAVKMMEHVDLGEYLKSKVSELSKGMQQKVQIIATLLHKPDLVIIDEPFSGLDPVNTQLIKELLYEINTEGVTIIMSTHQMHQIEEMADRLLMLNKGKRVLYGKVNEVRQNHAKNAIIVEGEGDWSTLQGVTAVEAYNGNAALLHLAEGISPDDVMAAMAVGTNYHVRRFELAVPSLNEIFIQVVGPSNNHQNGG